MAPVFLAAELPSHATVPGLPDSVGLGVRLREDAASSFELFVLDLGRGPDCALGVLDVRVREFERWWEVRMARRSRPERHCPADGAVPVPLVAELVADGGTVEVAFWVGRSYPEKVRVTVEGCRMTLRDDPFDPAVRLMTEPTSEPARPDHGELTASACGGRREVTWRYLPEQVDAARARAMPQDRSVWRAEAWRHATAPEAVAVVDEARARAQEARARGDQRSAAAILERCLLAAPREALDAIATEAAHAYIEAGIPEQAAAVAQRAVAEGSVDPSLLVLLGDSLVAIGDLDGAMRAYATASRDTPVSGP